MKTKLGRLRSLEIPGTTGSFDSARLFLKYPALADSLDSGQFCLFCPPSLKYPALADSFDSGKFCLFCPFLKYPALADPFDSGVGNARKQRFFDADFWGEVQGTGGSLKNQRCSYT